MFSSAASDGVRQRLLALAAADAVVVGAAVTGSSATGDSDRWSDVDLAFAIDGPLGPAIEYWTRVLYADFGAVHHWDLPSGDTLFRVYLLPGCLEVDIAFTPVAEFGARGPQWRHVFGAQTRLPPPDAGSHDRLAGLAWHHALHARICLERGRWWQAEYWIGAVRGQVLALACLRLGYPTSYAKGAHLLPAEVTGGLEATLVRSLEPTELWRALHSATSALAAELERTDPLLAKRLRPTLRDIGAPTSI